MALESAFIEKYFGSAKSEPRAVKSNPARDLAEQMRREYARRGFRGQIPVRGTTTVAVLVKAMGLFHKAHPEARAVFEECFGPSGQLDYGHFLFIRHEE